MKIRAILAVLAMVLCCGALLHADNLLVDRGLPTINLNNAADLDRSNVAWGDVTPSGGYNWATGDTFSVSGNSDITDLRVWIVAEDSQPPSSMWSDLTLLVGQAGSIAPISTTDFSNPNPNVQITNVTYADGSTYQGSSGSFINLYQVDFQLNWAVTANTTYYFFVGGTPTTLNSTLYNPIFGGPISPFLSASNALLSGSPQQGADNLDWEIAYTDTPYGFGSIDSFDSADPTLGIWDKSSDINVQIYGTPEPTSILLLGTAALIAASLARRRRQR